MQNVFREAKKEIEFSNRGNPNFPPHIHADIEFLYVKSGKGKAFCNGEVYNLREGSFFLCFPNQIHYYTDFDEDSDSIIVIIKPEYLIGLKEKFTEKLPVSPHYKGAPKDDNLLKVLNIAFEEHRKGNKKRIIFSILSAFFVMLLDRYELLDIGLVKNSTLKMLQYCKKHYKENISVESVAESLNISRSHISHTFNDKLKISFCDYINSLRLIEATNLFEDENLSITELSFLSGFNTIRSFNRVFYKHYGTSPSKYRAMHR